MAVAATHGEERHTTFCNNTVQGSCIRNEARYVRHPPAIKDIDPTAKLVAQIHDELYRGGEDKADAVLAG